MASTQGDCLSVSRWHLAADCHAVWWLPAGCRGVWQPTPGTDKGPNAWFHATSDQHRISKVTMSCSDGAMDSLQGAVVLSAALNVVGLPIINKCWTTSWPLTHHYPQLVSAEGTCNLQLWGVAYLAAAHSLNWQRHPQPWIFVVIALQKAFGTAWVLWWLLYRQNPDAVPPTADLEQIWGIDSLATCFMAIYGACEFGFACIFLHIAELGFCAPPPPRKRRTIPTRKERTLRTLLYLGAFGSRYAPMPSR